MKTNKSRFLVLPLLVVSLAGCGNTVRYQENLDKYVKTMEYHDGFNILQLTDIHWGTATDEHCSERYISKVINEAKAECARKGGTLDLIELTGDLFMLSNTETVNDFLRFFQNTGVPFATVWGNHDREGKYNPNWLTKRFLEASNSLYTEVDHDNVYGRSNYVINLMSGDKVAWQLAELDSGASYSESSVGLFRTYDFIRPDQAEWWKAEHDAANANKLFAAEQVPTIAYYHIAQYENELAYNIFEANGNAVGGDITKAKYFKLEKFASSEKNQMNFFETGRTNGLKGAFMGHAHADDWTCDYKGVTLGLGVKSGSELYYGRVDEATQAAGNLPTPISGRFDLLGGSLVTLHDDSTFELSHLYLNEKSSGDLVEWEAY